MNIKMINRNITRVSGILAFASAAMMLLFTAGCAGDRAANGSRQRAFTSPQQAIDAAITALKENNNDQVLAIFGPDADELIFSGDPVADRMRRQTFLQAYDQQHRLEMTQDKTVLIVGPNDWPYPIPLVKEGREWFFDTDAGREEILNRRIGRNELSTVQTMLALVDAQREYAVADQDGDGLLEYAQKFRSDAGTHNGLYWPTEESEKPSPLGTLVAQAVEAGYGVDSSEGPEPFNGYYYRMLTAQGQNAEGGAFDYMVNDSMIGGFAALAYPAEYGNAGVMTFIVNHSGIVYQKDLGEQTEQEAQDIKLFDPDATWIRVQ